MTLSPWMSVVGHFTRLLRRSLMAKMGAALAAITSVVVAESLLSGAPVSLIQDALAWLGWSALLCAVASLKRERRAGVASERLMTLRGIDRWAQSLGREGARTGALFLFFAVPSFVFAGSLAFRVRSLQGAAATSLTLLGFVAASVLCALTLNTLAALCAASSERRPAPLLVTLVLVPDMLHAALPQLPSLLASYRWFFGIALDLGVR